MGQKLCDEDESYLNTYIFIIPHIKQFCCLIIHHICLDFCPVHLQIRRNNTVQPILSALKMPSTSTYLFSVASSISIILLSTIQSLSCQQQVQFLTFWDGSTCTGDPFANTSIDAINIPIVAESTTISYQVNGL